MNKAFVREPEEPEDLKCPSCGRIGQAVGLDTLRSQLPAQELSRLSASACYCDNPTCEVGYFDAMGQRIAATLLRTRTAPKFPGELACLCLRLTEADVVADAKRRDPKRVRQVIAASRDAASRCAALMPDGQCCLRYVQPLYLKNL